MSADTHDYNGIQTEFNYASDHDNDYEREAQGALLEAHLHFVIQDFLDMEEDYGEAFMLKELAHARSRRLQRS